MTTLPRFLGSLFSASLLVAASGCTDAVPDSSIDVAIHGDKDHAWVLTGPADRAEELAERLAVELSANGMTEGNATAAISHDDTVVEVPLAFATSAVTALLLGGTAGIVTGGFIASRVSRHDLVAAAGLASAAALLIAITVASPPVAILLPLFAAVGFSTGVTGPSRDLIVRAATPSGASGRVYGFVYSGLDVGSMLGPVWFGFMLDHGMGDAVFVGAAACLAIAIGTVLQVRRIGGARTA